MIFRPKSEDKKEREGTEGIISFIFKYLLFRIITNIVRFIGILLVLRYNRKRELAADLQGAKIVGVNTMLVTLKKLLALENKAWVVDGIDLTEDENVQQGEPNSLSLLKFNPEKKKRGFLDLLRTHPTFEERIERLENLKKKKNSTGIA
jgi:Zn-dependent protease with chaperone function